MTRLAEFILGLFTLIEAEGRLLRLNVSRLASSICLLVIGFFCGAVALGFFCAAIYKTLLLFLATPVALLIMGCVCALLALVLIWGSTKCRGTKKKTETTSRT